MVKKAEVNINQYLTKRDIMIDEKKLNLWVNILNSEAFVDNIAPSNSGFVEFSDSFRYPAFIQSLAEDVKFLYGLKDEAKSYKFAVCPPYNGSSSSVLFNVPPAKISTVCRAVLIFGASENFMFKVNQQGMTAEASLYIDKNKSFALNIQVASTIQISFNSDRSVKAESVVKGGRTSMKYKAPSKRTILVIDYDVDKNILIDTIGNKIEKVINSGTLADTEIKKLESIMKERQTIEKNKKEDTSIFINEEYDQDMIDFLKTMDDENEEAPNLVEEEAEDIAY